MSVMLKINVELITCRLYLQAVRQIRGLLVYSSQVVKSLTATRGVLKVLTSEVSFG